MITATNSSQNPCRNGILRSLLQTTFLNCCRNDILKSMQQLYP